MADILVVDDSTSTRMHVCSVVSQLGHATRQADNGLNAMAAIHEKLPDLLILDLLMPEMDGIEVLEALKKQNIALKIIIISADIQDEVRSECFDLGVSAFLNKPFKVDELTALVLKIVK